MLEPGVIPDKEPIIRVAVVMPEDNFKKIVINTPSVGGYRISDEDGNVFELGYDERYEFHLHGDLLKFVSNKGEKVSKKWIVTGEDANNVGTKRGIKVKNVITGRNFHWRKLMDMYIPGTLEFHNLNGKLFVVNEVPLEVYLVCVATSEMGARCPRSFLEAQTIVARSWLLANVEMKHRSLGVDVCNDDCCQRYQGATFLTKEAIEAASNTYGKVLMYGDKICDARYSKSCGGVTERIENVWGGEPLPYSISKLDAPASYNHPSYPLDSEDKVRKWIDDKPPTFCSSYYIPEKELIKYLGGVDVEGRYFRWIVNYTQQQLNSLLKSKLNLKSRYILDLVPLRRGDSGRIIDLRIDYVDLRGEKQSMIIKSEYKIRDTLSKKFLYSSAFYVKKEPEGDVPREFILKGAGWGHGVGLCQIGALGMSLKGYTVEDILYHYYVGAELKKIY